MTARAYARATALDLFAGAAGGWHLACERLGVDVVAACEIDPWRRAVYSHRWPATRMYDDVSSLTAARLAADGIAVDIIVGSPPCQDASTANTSGRGVDGARTGLFFEALRLVRELRPLGVCLENVPGIRARGSDRVIAELEASDYAAWPLVVGAVHAGAPHLRKRVWFVAADRQRLRQLESSGRVEAQRRWAGDVSGEWPAPDASGDGRRQGRPGRPDPSDARQCQPERPLCAAADSDRDGIRIESGRRSGPDWPGAERLAPWHRWNGGAPDLGRVDDGLSAALADRRGIGRACLAAGGDAVVPQVAQAVLSALLSLLAAPAIAAAPRNAGVGV